MFVDCGRGVGKKVPDHEDGLIGPKYLYFHWRRRFLAHFNWHIYIDRLLLGMVYYTLSIVFGSSRVRAPISPQYDGTSGAAGHHEHMCGDMEARFEGGHASSRSLQTVSCSLRSYLNGRTLERGMDSVD